MESPRGLERPTDRRPSLEPVTGTKVQRVVRHTQALVDDVKDWVDLRIELAQIELEERVEAKANEVALGVALAGIALLAVVFGLVTLALGLGAWLGHPAWGFLVVTALLALLFVVVRAARPAFVQLPAPSRKAGRSEAGDDPSPPSEAPTP